MGVIVKGYNLLLNGLAVLAGILIFSSFVMIVIDVSMRIAGLTPPPYTIPVVEYSLLWFTLLAAPWLVRIKGHVFIDAATQFLPKFLKTITAKIVYALCIVAALIYCYHSAGLMITAWQENKIDVRSVDMPQWILFAPMPLCFFLVAVEFGRYLVGVDDMYDKSILERELV